MLGQKTIRLAADKVTAAAEDTKQSIVTVGLVAVVALVCALVSLALGALTLRAGHRAAAG